MRRTGTEIAAVLMLCWALGGCGTESNLDVRHPPPSAAPGLEVRVGGQVRMPDGRVARQSSWLVLVGEALVQRAEALFAANVKPVGPGVRVSLGILRPDGSLEGPLATATTDAGGRYQLALPDGRDPASVCRYVVYVGERGSAALTRALLTAADDAQDIDFQTEALVRLLLDRVVTGFDLCAASVTELRGLLNRIRALPDVIVGTNAADVNLKARQVAGVDEVLQSLLDQALAPTPTPVHTPRYTFTASATRTATGTRTATPTRTQTPTRTNTPTITATRPPTRTPTPGATTATAIVSPTPTLATPGAFSPTPTATATQVASAELVRTCTLRPGATASRVFVQLPEFGLSINLSGRQEWRFGPPDENGVRQITIPREGTVFSRVSLPAGAGFACVRLSADSSGFVDCDGGTPGYDTLIEQDHNTTNPPRPDGGLPQDPQCTANATLPDGQVTRATLEGADDPHPGVCRSPVLATRSGQFPPGGMLLYENLCLRIQPPGSMDPCPPTTEPCDPEAGELALSGSITSGTTEVVIYDQGNTARVMRDATVQCGNVPCVAKVAGAPFPCDAIEAGDLSRGRLGFGFPVLDVPLLNAHFDLIGILTVVCQPPPTPAP